MSKPSFDTWQVYRRLLGYARPYWAAFLLAVIANVCYGYLDAKFIALIEPFINKGLAAKDMAFLGMVPLVVVGIVALRGLANITAEYCLASVGRRVVMVLRQQLFEKLLHMPAAYFDKASGGELLTKLVFNTEQIARATTDAVTAIFKEGAFIAYLLYFMFVASWRLSLVFLLCAPVIAVAVSFTSRRFRQLSRQIQDSMGDITQTAQEAVDGYKVVKTYNGYAQEVGVFDKVSNRNRQQGMKLILTKALSVSTIQLIAAIAFAVTLYFAADEVLHGRLDAGKFIALMGLILALLKPLKQITTVSNILAQGLTAAHSVFEVLDKASEPDAGQRVIARAQGALEYRDVHFSYGGEPVLRGINFQLAPGQKLALVGRSGSGKSTIASLLLRYYSPSAGQILLDGAPIDELQLACLREQVAIVSQQVTLFNDTVANNIAYGSLRGASEAQIIAAAKTAHAWAFIQDLPQGLQTVVGENGSLLSGGQRQRLAIARAILKNAPILVLDEATSALDTESERFIQAGLEELMKGCTSLIIAHRLSTIESADTILVIDGGRVVEAGNHHDLLARGGEYARLHALQFSE